MEPWPREYRRGAAWVAILAAVAGGIAVASVFWPTDAWVRWIHRAVVGMGNWGALVYVVAFVLATLLLFPVTPFQLGAGVAFGLVAGITIAFAASMVTAVAGFALARYRARAAAQALAARYPGFAAIEAVLTEGSWRLVALLRLSLLLPFGVSNYLFGLTRVGFAAYMVGSLAMLPATAVPVYMAYIGRSIAVDGAARSPFGWATLVMGSLATVAATVWMSRAASRKLRDLS